MRSRAARLLPGLLGLLTTLGVVLPAPADGGDAAEAPDASTWVSDDGLVHRLYRPRFVAAATLLEEAASFGLGSADLALDPLRKRILLTAPEEPFHRAAEALEFLDAPTPEVLVEVSLVETAGRHRRQTGGHGLFDRDQPPGAPDTFFRGVRYDFEPDDWLRSQLIGERAFEGTSARFGHSDAAGTFAGTLELVLRSLAHRGEADYLANPTLVCTEGVPSQVSATMTLPATVFTRTATGAEYTHVGEPVGVTLEVLAEHVGSDAVRLKVHPWVRRLEEASAEQGPIGYPVLGQRELTTTIVLADGEAVLVGGLGGLRRLRHRAGLPFLDRLPALDSWISGRGDDDEETDILFLVRARILRPGRTPAPVVPPGEVDRLARARGPARPCVPPRR